jgi:hypothetical protein
MEKRKWMCATVFDVETGKVENLAGIGRAICEFIPFGDGPYTLTTNSGTSYGVRETWLQRRPSNNSSSHAIVFLQKQDPQCIHTAEDNHPC